VKTNQRVLTPFLLPGAVAGHNAFVAEADGHIVGYLLLRTNWRKGVTAIKGVAVDPAYQLRVPFGSSLPSALHLGYADR
jgi:ribosomal protein S18 acetylase RimI-like enzyme